MSKIFKASLIIAVAFGLNKVLALFRQYLIVKEFGFTSEIDAFNVANNMPDLIFSLFSGGALAMAFIPVFAEYINVEGRSLSWKLFSKIATILFLVTAVVSVVIGFVAPILVSSQIGIAPGFTGEQQALVVELLRINLVATLIFSISGLITASLQAHKHFAIPAIAPLFYNIGIILGALILAPATPIEIGNIILPAFGLGIYGLTYGVVLGAFLHFLIQVPAIIHYEFKFSFSVDIKDIEVRKIFKLMGPRILTVLLIQIMFLMRDNFASRLEVGSVTALTYGYFIMQVPETLIGSSIAIALLPTLSTFISENKKKEFARALSIAVRVLISASLISTVLVFVVLSPVIDTLFDFTAKQSHLLVWTTNAFMAGLLAQTLLEVFVRAFYAQKKVAITFYATLIRTILFAALGIAFYRETGAVGIAAIDSFAVTIETLILFFFLLPFLRNKGKILHTLVRSLAGCAVTIVIFWLTFSYLSVPPLIQTGIGGALALSIYLLFVWKEVKLLVKL